MKWFACLLFAVLGGCADDSKTPSTFAIATATTGGIYYPFGGDASICSPFSFSIITSRFAILVSGRSQSLRRLGGELLCDEGYIFLLSVLGMVTLLSVGA